MVSISDTVRDIFLLPKINFSVACCFLSMRKPFTDTRKLFILWLPTFFNTFQCLSKVAAYLHGCKNQSPEWKHGVYKERGCTWKSAQSCKGKETEPVTYLATPQLSEYLQIGQHHETQWCHVCHQKKTHVIHFGVNLSWKEKSSRKGPFKYTYIQKSPS